MEGSIRLNELKERLSQNINFHAQYYSETHLKRRLKIRMYSTKSQTFEAYSRYLDGHPGEYDLLKDVLTVNVTEFFRNPEMFEAIKNEVLPVLFDSKTRSGHRTLRIWSAGCSDGKEAISIVMLLYEMLGEKIGNFLIRVFATDIDEKMLEKARSGFYKFDEVAGIKRDYLEKYFIKEDSGYRVLPDLKSYIRFEKVDLINGKRLSSLDIIFCRNVVIYFSNELKEKLYMNFYDSLVKGGFFVMGKTETLVGEAKNSFVPFDNIERIYLKE